MKAIIAAIALLGLLFVTGTAGAGGRPVYEPCLNSYDRCDSTHPTCGRSPAPLGPQYSDCNNNYKACMVNQFQSTVTNKCQVNTGVQCTHPDNCVLAAGTSIIACTGDLKNGGVTCTGPAAGTSVGSGAANCNNIPITLQGSCISTGTTQNQCVFNSIIGNGINSQTVCNVDNSQIDGGGSAATICAASVLVS